MNYRILVRGRLGRTMRTAFPDLYAQAHGEDTLLTGVLPDQAALYGVLDRVEALGLELLEVRRESPSGVTPPHPGARNAEPSGHRRRSHHRLPERRPGHPRGGLNPLTKGELS